MRCAETARNKGVDSRSRTFAEAARTVPNFRGRVAGSARGVLLQCAVLEKRTHWPRLALLGSNLAFPFFVIAAGLPWVLFVPLFCLHCALMFALIAPRCAWLGPVVTRFRTAQREVWLTIDDGPDGVNSAQLAGELSRRGVRATFFVKGRKLAHQAETARTLLDAGHTLANHTATHPIISFWFMFPFRLRREIDLCNDALRQAGVAITRWFRAPLGMKHLCLHRELRRRGMRLIAWNVRGFDGLVCRPETVVRRVQDTVAPGSIILLHECMPQSNRTILQVVDALLARGYAFVIPADERLI